MLRTVSVGTLRRGVAALALAAVCTAGIAASAQSRTADLVFVNVYNESTNCAWFTVYAKGDGAPWKIVGGNESRPRWLLPGQRHLFRTSSYGSKVDEVRVRAEIRPNRNGQPACQGSGGEPDISAYRGANGNSVTLRLTGRQGVSFGIH